VLEPADGLRGQAAKSVSSQIDLPDSGVPKSRNIGHTDLRPDHLDRRFSYLRQSVVADLVELQVRKIGHLLCRDHAIDDGRAVRAERLIDLGMQLSGLGGAVSMAAERLARAR
jgi:hypothetical protein